MKTVYDFIRGKSALEVTCRNCDHRRVLDTRHLREKLGLHGRVAEAVYRCTRCESGNVRLCSVDAELARVELDRMPFFGGVYAKHLD